MTALICVVQRDCAYLACDAATYDRAHKVVGFRGKIDTISQWPGAMATLGNAAMSPLMAKSLALEFRRWDDLITNADRPPGIVAGLMDDYAGMTGADLVLVGYSRKRGFEAYQFTTDAEVPALVKLPAVVMSPMANDQVIPAQWSGINPGDDPDLVLWSIRKYMEMARHTVEAKDVGSIGGFCTLATITRDRIEQRVIQEWSEDSMGGPLRVWPIDWTQWHRENPKPKPSKNLRVCGA
jgi:hypothetical protein